MNGEIKKFNDLEGPSISGTVTVPLLELDKMRAAHANAVAIAKELKEKEMWVKVFLIEKKVSDPSVDYRGRYVPGTEKYAEIGVEYKGLEDFREIIREEELDKIHEQHKAFTREIQRLKDSILKNEEQRGKNHSEFVVLQKSNQELLKEKETLSKENEDLKAAMEKANKRIEVQVSLREGINSRLEAVLKELHEWKVKKSFWYGVFH